MPVAWRIVHSKHQDAAFTGEGAAKYGGRWNSRGTWVIYASSTMSLAALELLVHINPMPELRFMAFKLEFDERFIEKLDLKHLPRDCRMEPPGPPTRILGDQWIRAGRTPVLAVPSIHIPSENNYLLNPAHADFKKIRIGKPEAFAFDPRLL